MIDPNAALSPQTLYCSFCGKSQHEVRNLVAASAAYICNECTELCADVIAVDCKASLMLLVRHADRLGIRLSAYRTLEEVLGEGGLVAWHARPLVEFLDELAVVISKRVELFSEDKRLGHELEKLDREEKDLCDSIEKRAAAARQHIEEDAERTLAEIRKQRADLTNERLGINKMPAAIQK